MPTYVCSIQPGSLSEEQKAKVAAAISRAHSEATGAPTYFVQVIVDENPKSQYLGGEKAKGHIWIRGDIRAGRTEEQRNGMMLNMMREVSAITGVKESDIWIYLCNLAPTDMIEYGHVLPRPGEEQAWFGGLPDELRSYLKGLGTDRSNFEL